MYLRSGGIGPSARTHKHAPTRRVHIITRDGPTFAGLFRVLCSRVLMKFSWGIPADPPARALQTPGGGTRENDQRTLQQARRAEGLKLLNCFPFIFQPPAAGQLKLPPPYVPYQQRADGRQQNERTRQLNCAAPFSRSATSTFLPDPTSD